ncbi:MAG TPA: DUF3048 domain-containing protein [Clostridiaceae bacterium]|nr:DUF3048 domain-containing protein [Clostridiaceae bacterium]
MIKFKKSTNEKDRKIVIKKNGFQLTKNNKILLISGLLIAVIIIFAAIIIANNSGDSLQPVANTEDETDIVPEDNLNSDENGSDTADDSEDNKDINPKEEFILPKEGIRPYAVMIDNEGTRSLPQGGLYKAQLIYEIIVEGGETRLMPVFWDSSPELIGPVRSSRHYFLDYAMEHDAIYVHYGWSPMAQRDISAFKINNINGVGYGGEIFWELTKDPNNWQDSYTSMENIKKFTEKAKYRTSTEKKLLFEYNDTDKELENGERAEKITMRYSSGYTCGFEYDSETGLYNRLRKEKPHMERNTNEQLTAKNIIIQKVKNYPIPGDPEGRQEVVTVSKGSGWYITGGKAIEINWSKDSRNAQTKYTDKNGNPITLNPGQTWIQIVPIEGAVTIE